MKLKFFSFGLAILFCLISLCGCEIQFTSLPINEDDEFCGETAKEFKGVDSTIVYEEAQYICYGDDWKSFDTNEGEIVVHILKRRDQGLKDYYIDKHRLNSDFATRILYELSLLTDTGGTANEISDTAANDLVGTVWVQTPSKYYRILPAKKEVHLISKDAYGPGKQLTYSHKLDAFLRFVSNYAPYDNFSGSYSLSEKKLLVKKHFDGNSKDILIVKDVLINTDRTPYIDSVELEFIPENDGEYVIKSDVTFNSGDKGKSDNKAFTAKAGERIKVVLSVESNNGLITILCNDIKYEINVIH